MDQERRKRTRVDIHLDTVVQVANQDIHVQSHNLSLKGMLCSSHEAFQADQSCLVTMNLNGDPEGEPVRAVFQGRIVRTSPEETAIDFTLMDADSFLHLKRIVEYHTEEPEKISHELLTTAFAPTFKE